MFDGIIVCYRSMYMMTTLRARDLIQYMNSVTGPNNNCNGDNDMDFNQANSNFKFYLPCIEERHSAT